MDFSLKWVPGMPLQSIVKKTCKDWALCYRCQKQPILVMSQPVSSARSRRTNTEYFLIALHILWSSKVKLICTALLLIELEPQSHLNCSSAWHSLGRARHRWKVSKPDLRQRLPFEVFWAALPWDLPSCILEYIWQTKKFVSVFISQDINISFVVGEILLPGSDPNLMWHAVFVTLLQCPSLFTVFT